MIKLSILISTLLERRKSLERLLNRLEPQLTDEVEILMLSDNRKRATGSKFQILLDNSLGKYITFIDDDDLVSEDFISEIIKASAAESDVIVYNSEAILNGSNPFIVTPGLEYQNEQVKTDSNGKYLDIKRTPWHWCSWKSSLAKYGVFSDNYIDCDWFWLKQIIPKAKTETRIDKVMHFYKYDSHLSRAAKGESSTDGTL